MSNEISYKLDILDNKIKREVQDLHPLLTELFSRQVSAGELLSVEYTHGVEEYGADFVLSNKGTFSGEHYFGVVVKCGKLLAKDLPILRTQISQCLHTPRVIQGKGNLFISQVLILTTGTISKGVKNSLSNEYKNSQIEYVEGPLLVSMIDKFFPAFWDDIDGKIADYLKESSKAIARIDAQSTLYQGNGGADIYIKPRITTKESSKSAIEKNDKIGKKHSIDIYKAIADSKVVLVQSGMGGGKSKLLRKIFNHYCENQVFKSTGILPILIPYTSFSDDYNSDLESVINDKLSNVLSISDDLTPLIMIDGIDEKMLEVAELEAEFNNICNQVTDKDVKLVVTSRYVGEYEYCKCDDINFVKKCNIEPLNARELVELIKLINNNLNITDKLMHDIETSPLFRDMKRTPIVGEILASILERDRSELPSNLPELYAQYSEIVLGRWEVNKNILSSEEYDVIKTVTMKICKDFIDHQRDNLTFKEFEYYFTSYVSKRPYNFSGEELVGKLMKRSTFFYFDIPTRTVHFKHRSFIEYFYALDKSSNGGLKMSSNAYNPYWTNIFYFYFGIRKDCEHELSELIDIKPENLIFHMSKFVNFSNFLLASYSTPEETVIEVIEKVILEISEVIYNVLEMKYDDSPFSKLPSVYVYMLFTLLFTENYNYDFIGQYIPTIYDRIEEQSSIHKRNKVMAGYLLSILGIHRGQTSTFIDYFSRYKVDMPLELKMIVDVDSRTNDFRDKYEDIKSTMKSIDRSMKRSDSNLRKLIMNTPISKRQITFDNN